MAQHIISPWVAVICLFVLSLDLSVRWRKGRSGVMLDDSWGSIPYPYLSLVSVGAVFAIGWFGWLLVVLAALGATERLRIGPEITFVGENDSKQQMINRYRSQLKQTHSGVVFVVELITVGLLFLKSLVSIFMLVDHNL